MVPWLIALMGWGFVTYLLLKGLNWHWIWTVPTQTAMLLGKGVPALVFVRVRQRAGTTRPDRGQQQENRQRLVHLAVDFCPALLSFTQGSRAVVPLAAILASDMGLPTEMSLHVLAYNLKRVMSILGIAEQVKAINGGFESLFFSSQCQ